ncbi:hypothetical protein HMPREF1546_01602 [Oscillibacter sp. KLE 1745]|nr:hypothetical protein HMPREF1546_01602 [Oscillibacter sp. KLE 1745]
MHHFPSAAREAGSSPERSHTNPISSTLTRPLRPSTFHPGPGRTVRSPA